MKYFVDQETHWDYEGYWKQLNLLEDKFTKRSFDFFRKHSFHDAIVLSFNIINGTQITKRRRLDPTIVEAKLVDYMDDFEYTIRWKGVIRYDFTFDAKNKQYIGLDDKLHVYEEDWSGLEEWAYDEITALDDKYLSHEIELHSGARIIIYFKSMDYRRSQKKVKKKWANKVLIE